MLEEPYKLLLDLYARTPPVVQGVVLLGLIVLILWLWSRKRSIKADLRHARVEIREKELDLEKARTQLTDARQLATRLEQDRNELREKVGGLEERLKTADEGTGKLQEQLQDVEKDRQGLEERLQKIEKTDADIWCRDPVDKYVRPHCGAAKNTGYPLGSQRKCSDRNSPSQTGTRASSSRSGVRRNQRRR